MYRRTSALLALVVILIGTLTLAARERGTVRRDAAPPADQVASRDELTPILRKLTALLTQIEIEQATGAKDACASCQSTPDVANCVPVHGQQQVRMQLLIAEVDRAKLQNLALSWLPVDRACESSATRHTQPGCRSACDGSTPLRDRQSAYRIANPRELQEHLITLQAEGHAKIVATPSTVTVSGRSATMLIGGEFPVLVPHPQDMIAVESCEYGTRVECMPIVLDDDRVLVEIESEQSSLDWCHAVVRDQITAPGLVRRRLAATLEMNSGETIALGGAGRSSDSSTCPHATCLVAPGFITSHILGGLPVLPCPALFSRLCRAPSQIADGHLPQDRNELLVVITAELCKPVRSGNQESIESAAVPPVGSRARGPSARVTDLLRAVGSEDTAETECDRDASGPHTPAVLLRPATAETAAPRLSEVAAAHDTSAKAVQGTSELILFGQQSNSDASILGSIEMNENEAPNLAERYRTGCCMESEEGQSFAVGCCRSICAKLDAYDEGDEMELCDADCDEAIDSFIEQVLHAQALHLESIMRARVQHERELMGARIAAETAIAQLKLDQSQEVMRLRTEHMAEVQRLREAMWESDLKAIEARHRRDIEHDRELADLRHKHAAEIQAQRTAVLESELQRLRSQRPATHESNVAQAQLLPVRPTPSVAQARPIELPVHVEDLASGRVRYGPASTAPTDVVIQVKPHDSADRGESRTPFITDGPASHVEIEQLRREVTRLRALVEDLLCVVPESPPSPMPHASSDHEQ